ncbi:hypothetical protein, partial [Pseudomonas sp. MF6755]|uniref:hypothetical protein n=1 Tax=Pseudomonas sp. MF6755 TaxID=2797530 RepID=UPI001E6513C2
LRVCLRLPAYSASAKVICFIGKLGGWGRGILPNQKVFFRVSLERYLLDSNQLKDPFQQLTTIAQVTATSPAA